MNGDPTPAQFGNLDWLRDKGGPRFTYSQAVYVLMLLGIPEVEAYRAVSWCQVNPQESTSPAEGVQVIYRGGTYWWGIKVDH